MTSEILERRRGVTGGRAFKLPCRVATTANITLSGLQTIDGVTVVADDRVLVKDQTTGSQNGIYVADTGAWVRAPDFDGTRDSVQGTLVLITSGTDNATTVYQLTTATPVIGTSSLTFAVTGTFATPWVIKTTTYTASMYERIAANTTSAAFTITLPASPTNGQSVWFDDPLGTWATNNLTIARNGNNIHGAAANLTCDVSCRFELVYYSAGGGWTVRLGPPGPAGSTGASGTADSASSTVTLTAQAYTTVTGDLRKTLLVTTGATDATITLSSASLAGDGKHISFRKADSGAGKVIITDGSTAHAWLLTQGDTVRLRVNGTAWEAVDCKIATTIVVYTANDTWTKPPLLKSVDVWAIGGGAGGGSGRRGAAGGQRFGGGGGAASGINFLNGIPASSLAATETVTVAATAAGGAAVAVDDTDGNAGTNGNDSSFGSLIKGKAGNAGSGGTATAGTGGVAATSTTMRVPITGGSASSTSATPTSVGTNVVGSGSAGGGLSAANVERAGGTPGTGSSASFTTVSAGAGGAVGGAAGTAGNSISNSLTQEGGSGGGGGGANAAAAGGAGAAGGSPGGGGGGGGASVNGFASGAGAAGARGEIRVTQRF